MTALEVTYAATFGTLCGMVFGALLVCGLSRRSRVWVRSGRRTARRAWQPLDAAPLSGRAHCIEVLWTEMERAAQGQRQVAVLVLDCDRFKLINDAYGYAVGDVVLREVARRIRHAAPPGHRMLRAGGDEFVVLAEWLGDEGSLLAAGARLVDAFDEPLDVSGQPIYTSVSVGLAVAPQHGAHPEAVLAAAEGALRKAKRAGRRTARLYDLTIGERESRRAQALQQLHRAFDGGQLLLHYQPKIRLADGACTGFEALLRLRTSQGLEGPGLLIEAAERSGFISRLGEWVFEQAAAQALLWRAAGLEVPIAVNLSARQLQDPRFLAFVEARVARDPLLPCRLQLEITESALAEDQLQSAGALSRLRSLGFDIQVDDFGTGYSTMGFLSRMPVDTLKIDGSFIASLPEDKDGQQIVRAMIGMAHDLAMCVVAEGVETKAQAQWLRDCGCDQGQGFLFARALPPEQAAAFALGERCWPGLGSENIPRASAGLQALAVE